MDAARAGQVGVRADEHSDQGTVRHLVIAADEEQS